MCRYNSEQCENPVNRSASVSLIVVAFLYALFALSRIKYISFWKIEGLSTTNEIWIFSVLFFIYIFKTQLRNNKKPKSRSSISIGASLYILVLIITVGAFRSTSLHQYLYAVLLFLTPILMFFVASELSRSEIDKFIKFFIVISIIYSIFALVLATNYAFFTGLVGNTLDSNLNRIQNRGNMMIGSSISASYYFNLTLPLSFYLFFTSGEKTWRRIALMSVITNILATFVLLSRNAALITMCVLAYYVSPKTKNKSDLFKQLAITFSLVIAVIFGANKYNFSRLFLSISRSTLSAASRFDAAYLGLRIFTHMPFLGSGMGNVFNRVYRNRLITYDSITALIDPHNLYIMALSELGILGLLVLLFTFFRMGMGFSNIRDHQLKRTAQMSLVAFLISSLGGSQLMNNPSLAVIFWIYMGMFNAAISSKPVS